MLMKGIFINHPSIMNLKLKFLRMQSSEKYQLLVKRELEPLAKEIPFDHAQVTLEKPQERGSRVEARVHLAVPGPDIHAKAADYTVEAAWRKLGRMVRETWQRRLRNRQTSSQSVRPTHARAHG